MLVVLRGLSGAVLLVAVAAIVLLLGPRVEPGSGATPACPLGASLNVVAHEDDDLLFLSPDLLHDIRSGRCVRTVFVTAGDGGGGPSRWMSRELGAQAAYAQMAGAQSSWTVSSLAVEGHPLPLLTLGGHPEISLVFMRLPDGWLDGSGVSPNGFESLQKLWQGSIAHVGAVDGSSTFTRPELILTLASLMNALRPDTIRTQDYAGQFGDGDHSDHHATAYFVREAERAYAVQHVTVAYEDYGTRSRPQNVSGADFTAKRDAFYAYLAYDGAPCGSPPDCGSSGYADWLTRQYTVTLPATGGGAGDAGADLRLSARVDVPVAPVGGSLVWRLRVDDVNGAAADGAYVDVVLPAGVEVAAATTDRGPGCTSVGTGKLHCSLDWLSVNAPVGNVLLITKVTLPGELVLSATAAARGEDPVPADNTIIVRANVPAVVQSGALTPPGGRAGSMRPTLLPASATCWTGAGGIARLTATIAVGGPATVIVTVRDSRTGAVVWSLSGSRLGRSRLEAPGPTLSAVIADRGRVRLALRVATPRSAAHGPCGVIATVTATTADGASRRLRLRFRPGGGLRAPAPG